MTKNELMDWNHVAGICHPPMLRSVKSAANRFSEVGACSNADQKMAAKMNSTTITSTRFFSSASSPPNTKMLTKYTAAVPTSTNVMYSPITCASSCSDARGAQDERQRDDGRPSPPASS